MRCITEWQLDHRLALSWQHGLAADARLFLAMLSKYVDEQAPFVPCYSSPTPLSIDLYQKLSVRRSRSLAMISQDPHLMRQHSDALHLRVPADQPSDVNMATEVSDETMAPALGLFSVSSQISAERSSIQQSNVNHHATTQFMPKHSVSHACSLQALKLQLLLNPPPMVVQDNRQKLTADVTENLDAWTLARQASLVQDGAERDHTALYDVLEQVHHAQPLHDHA
jgi:hypothetical protein